MDVQDSMPTGFSRLDQIIGGLLPGSVVTIAGRPGSGKSAMAQQIAMHAAGQHRKVLYFTLEMRAEELAARAASGKGLTPRDLLVRGKGTPLLLAEWKERAASMDMEITSDGKTTGQIRRLIGDRKPGIAVIDTANLIKASGESERVRMLNVTRDIKQIAMDHEVAIIMLTQLNRDAEGKTLPTLADIKESGSVEEDSDIVVLLSEQPEYKDIMKINKEHILSEGHFDSLRKEGKVVLAFVRKNRHGAPGAVLMHFEGPRFMFHEIDEMYAEESHYGERGDELPF
jgi:replicative DNA helicase